MRIKSYHTIIKFQHHGYWIRKFRRGLALDNFCKRQEFRFQNPQDFYREVLSHAVGKTRLLVLNHDRTAPLLNGVYTELNNAGFVLTGYQRSEVQLSSLIFRDSKNRTIELQDCFN
jgi:hypothetical protein